MTTSTIIYHYTSIQGLIGIVTRQEFWASDCQYLNDGAELSYARDMYFDEVEKLGLPPLEEGGGYAQAGPSLESFRAFIVCFCEDGDLLSQWRGYGADQGYALGFDTEGLRNSKIGEIAPVQYGIPNPTEYFKEELAVAGFRSGHPGMVEWHASERLLPRLARVKHPGYAEEREWRILVQMPRLDVKESKVLAHFRPSSMGPAECLREVIIGPGPHAETRQAAVHDLLYYHKFRDVDVSVSRIPFRS
jgi:hypothetical protein